MNNLKPGYVTSLDPFLVRLSGVDEEGRPCTRRAPAEVGMRGEVDVSNNGRIWVGEYNTSGIPTAVGERFEQIGQSTNANTEIANQIAEEVDAAVVRIEGAFAEAEAAGVAADTALQEAQAALDAAMSGKATAEQAATAAQNAQTKADDAQAAADQALLDAAAALAAAEASGGDGVALARAQQAFDLATLSKEAADLAQSKAEAAETLAGTAASDAATAQAAAVGAQSTADSVEAIALAAQSAAQSAQGAASQAVSDVTALAGITGETIYQISKPTGTKADKKNLWIRSSDGKLHAYDGTDWVAVTDPTLVAAAAAAQNAQTAADNALTGVLEAKQLANDAQATASGAQSTADTAASKASTADGRVTVATANPTLSDGVGKPVNALWQVRAGNSVSRFYLWSGTAWAQSTVGTEFIGAKAISRAQIGDLAVGTAQMGDLTVTNAKIGGITVDKLLVTDGATFSTAVINTLIGDTAFWNQLHVKGVITVGGPNKIDGTTMITPKSITTASLAVGALDFMKATGVELTSGKISGTEIIGATVTGGIVRTAASGQRLELKPGGLESISAAGRVVAQLGFQGSQSNLTFTSDEPDVMGVSPKTMSLKHSGVEWGKLGRSAESMITVRGPSGNEFGFLTQGSNGVMKLGGYGDTRIQDIDIGNATRIRVGYQGTYNGESTRDVEINATVSVKINGVEYGAAAQHPSTTLYWGAKYEMRDGVVYLSGKASSYFTTDFTTVGYLNVKCRPPENLYFMVASQSGTPAMIFIGAADGRVAGRAISGGVPDIVTTPPPFVAKQI